MKEEKDKEKENTVLIHQDVNLYVAYLTKNHDIDYPLSNDRMAWLQLIKGTIKLNDQKLSAGIHIIISLVLVIVNFLAGQLVFLLMVEKKNDNLQLSLLSLY